MPGATEVRYYVLPDATNPYLLARVRWPDVFQAISSARPAWQDDVGLFDLPYSPSSVQVTLERAGAIASQWGAALPEGETIRTSDPFLIRRMPADWSNLSPAEKRAWALEFLPTGRRAGALEGSVANGRRVRSRLGRRRWGRKVGSSPTELQPEALAIVTSRPTEAVAEKNGDVPAVGADVVGLDDTTHDAMPFIDEPAPS